MQEKCDRILKNGSQIAKYLNCFQDSSEHQNPLLRCKELFVTQLLRFEIAIAYGPEPGDTLIVKIH